MSDSFPPTDHDAIRRIPTRRKFKPRRKQRKGGTFETGLRLYVPQANDVRMAAIIRGCSLDTLARIAMIRFARKKAGIVLEGGAELMTSRAEIHNVEKVRSLWLRLPVVWQDSLRDLLRQSAGVLRMSDLWRLALVEECARPVSEWPVKPVIASVQRTREFARARREEALARIAAMGDEREALTAPSAAAPLPPPAAPPEAAGSVSNV